VGTAAAAGSDTHQQDREPGRAWSRDLHWDTSGSHSLDSGSRIHTPPNPRPPSSLHNPTSTPTPFPDILYLSPKHRDYPRSPLTPPHQPTNIPTIRFQTLFLIIKFRAPATAVAVAVPSPQRSRHSERAADGDPPATLLATQSLCMTQDGGLRGQAGYRSSLSSRGTRSCRRAPLGRGDRLADDLGSVGRDVHRPCRLPQVLGRSCRELARAAWW